jgi:hypothetical protein
MVHCGVNFPDPTGRDPASHSIAQQAVSTRETCCWRVVHITDPLPIVSLYDAPPNNWNVLVIPKM